MPENTTTVEAPVAPAGSAAVTTSSYAHLALTPRQRESISRWLMTTGVPSWDALVILANEANPGATLTDNDVFQHLARLNDKAKVINSTNRLAHQQAQMAHDKEIPATPGQLAFVADAVNVFHTKVSEGILEGKSVAVVSAFNSLLDEMETVPMLGLTRFGYDKLFPRITGTSAHFGFRVRERQSDAETDSDEDIEAIEAITGKDVEPF